MSELAHTDKQQLIAQAFEQHAEGLSLRQIAAKIGISHVGLRKWLLTAPEQYRAAQLNGLTQRIIEADEMLESAEDAVTIARAREIAKFARWDAERRLPHMFGAKVEQLGGVQINVVIGDPLQAAKTVVNVPKCDATSDIIEPDAGESDASI